MQKTFFTLVTALFALSNLTAQTCANPRVADICPIYQASEDLDAANDETGTWTGQSGTMGNNGKEVFYAVTVASLGNMLPEHFSVSVSNNNSPVTVYFLGTSLTCGTSMGYEQNPLQAPASAPNCNSHQRYEIAAPGTYYFAMEGTGDADLSVGVVYLDSLTNQPADSVGCPKGNIQFETDYNACGYTPFKSTNPTFELCLNGTVLATDALLTFNLAPATNQLCIRTYVANTTGAEGIERVDFNFGPALTAVPTTRDCAGATLLHPFDTQAAMNGGVGSWVVSDFTNAVTPAPPAPAGVNLTNRIIWSFQNTNGRGDAAGCTLGGCLMYEFCFDITATNNDTADTKVVGVFYPDGYSQAPFAGGTRYVHYGCSGESNCYCALSEQCENDEASSPLVNTFEDPALLPLELLALKASKYQQRDVSVDWTVASETNNAAFIVERRLDGQVAWAPIGQVASQGNTSEARSYQFMDKNAPKTTLYYRIHQVGLDGRSTYSTVVAINMEQNADRAISVFPNPTKDQLHILLSADPEPGAQFELYDMKGTRHAITLHKTANARFETSVGHLPNGVYILRMRSGSTALQQKFIKN